MDPKSVWGTTGGSEAGWGWEPLLSSKPLHVTDVYWWLSTLQATTPVFSTSFVIVKTCMDFSGMAWGLILLFKKWFPVWFMTVSETLLMFSFLFNGWYQNFFFNFEFVFMQMPPASRKLKHRNRFLFQVLRHMDCQGFSFICRKFRPFHVSFPPTCALTEFLYGYYSIMHSLQVDDIVTILKISIYSLFHNYLWDWALCGALS